MAQDNPVQRGSGKKVANGLVAMSTAAVLAVYAAGYARTRSAAAQLDAQSEERRPAGSEGRGPAPASVTANPELHAPDSSSSPSPVHETAGQPVRTASLEPGAKAAGVSNRGDAPASVSPASPNPPTAPEPTVATPQTAAPVSYVASAPAAPVLPAATPAAPAVAEPVPVASAPAAPAPPPAPTWKDGTYTGWGTCRHGDIQAQVVIEGGRITSATISQCLTRYSCDVIGRLPPEVPQRQSAEVDYVSGATQSTNAFYYAVIEALGKAK